MFCISLGSLNDCSVVFLMMQSAQSSRTSTSRRWMTSEKPLLSWAWPGLRPGLPPGPGRLPDRLARGHARPTAQPRPAARPAGSGSRLTSRPALAGLQAGAPGNLTARGDSIQGSFPSSPDRHHLAQVECARKRCDLDRGFRIGNRTIKRGSQLRFSVLVIESSNLFSSLASFLLVLIWFLSWCGLCACRACHDKAKLIENGFRMHLPLRFRY